MDTKPKQLFEVTATDKKGYITYHCYQKAISAEQAIALQKMYYMPAGVRYTSIRATISQE